jgi:hypothetical protein
MLEGAMVAKTAEGSQEIGAGQSIPNVHIRLTPWFTGVV